MAISKRLLGACTYRPQRPSQAHVEPAGQLTESEQIAGEVMAYLVEVVLGRAGAPGKRPDWATRGLNLPLDFDMVVERMYGPVSKRAELMVLDTNILGLSRVLYHYDRRLNLFKGTRDHDSLYPCAELMALRLLLLKKMHRSEAVSMAALSRHIDLFGKQGRRASSAELAVMGLSLDEFIFLRAVFHSEPVFLRYLRHPFIVSTLQKIGAAETDPLSLPADLSANYRRFACPPPDRPIDRPVTVAIVAAMNPMFDPLPATGEIRPSTAYLELREQLEARIRSRLAADTSSPLDADRLAFFTPDRPVAIHPDNADRVIGQICPTANFTLIVLGKNVYRSMAIDPHEDIYPHKRWIYLNTDDIQYDQIDAEINTVIAAVRPILLAARRSAYQGSAVSDQ